MPSRSNVHIDTRLTSYAVGYAQQNPTWLDRAILTVPVTKQSDLYPVYGNEAFQLSQDIIGNAENPWPAVDWEMSDSTYFCTIHGLTHFVPGGQEPKYRAQEERDGVSLLTAKLKVNEAYAAAAFLQSGSNFTTAMTAVDFTVATTDVKDYFYTEINAIHTACGMDADTFVCARDVLQGIARNTIVRDDIKYTSQALAQGQGGWERLERLVADYLGLKDVISVPTLYNNDNQVSTTLAAMWTAGVGLLYVRGEPSGQNAGANMGLPGTPKAATRFVWTGANQLSEQVAAWRVPDALTGLGGDWIRVAKAYALVVNMAAGARLGTGLVSGGES